MTTICPCFGKNENCRLCGGSGHILSEVEAQIARKQHAMQMPNFAGLHEPEKLEALSPEGQKAIKTKKEKAAKAKAERAARDAEQAEKSIAYWKSRWGEK